MHLLRPRPVPRSRRRAAAAALAAGLVAFALAACQSDTALAPEDAWTEAELAGVFDLAELGTALAPAPDGAGLLLDGRRLPPDLLERFPHLTMGRHLDLLRLAPDAFAAMAPRAAEFLVAASPTELRARLADYGLTVADVRAAWGAGGALDLAALHAIADRLDAGLRPLAGPGAGTRLLADLGVAR